MNMLAISLLSFSLLVTLIIIARKPRPIENKKGLEFNNAARDNESEIATKDTFIVGTFNIQTGKNQNRERNINNSANAIKNADLIGVQEVYAPNHLQLIGIGRSQPKVLADTGNFNWLFSASQKRWFREHRGNLILSRLPVSDWKIEMLPNEKGENFRNITTVKVTWKGQTFHFINTHIQTRYGREKQRELVLEEFAKYPKAILVGDLNSRPDTPMLKELLKNKSIIDTLGVTEVNADEVNRVDWVLTKGFKIHKATMLEKGISDHPYYEVTVSFIA